MAIVNIPASLKQHTQNQRKIIIEENNLQLLLQQLVTVYPALKNYIFTDDDRLCHFVGIYINAKLVRHLETSLAEDDEVTLVPAVAGG